MSDLTNLLVGGRSSSGALETQMYMSSSGEGSVPSAWLDVNQIFLSMNSLCALLATDLFTR